MAISLGAFCLWVSLCLLLHLWLARRAPLTKKLYWSFIILIPFIGWVLYGGCFQVPGYNSSPCTSGPPAGGGGGV